MAVEHPLDLVFNPYTSLFLPHLIPLAVLLKIRRGRGPLWAKIGAPILFYIALAHFFGLGTFGWKMRSELHLDSPKATDQTPEALFWANFWLFFVFSLFCSSAGFWAWRRALKPQI